jgi:hypothetical protein
MTSARTFSLLAAATVFSGWLAGAALERAAVVMRAWLTLGPESWARFGQGAASATGLTLDAGVGVAAAALIIAAAASAAFDRCSDPATPGSLVIAAVFSVLGLMFAAKAMNLVQLLAASPSKVDLPPIFEAYLIWGVDFRAAAAAVAFVAVVLPLLGLSVAGAPEKSRAEAPAE